MWHGHLAHVFQDHRLEADAMVISLPQPVFRGPNLLQSRNILSRPVEPNIKIGIANAQFVG